ncbi:MAG: hypothetical protein QNL24_04240 [Akkermansiaceae bacterium]
MRIPFKKTLLISGMLFLSATILFLTDSCTPTYSRAEFETAVSETTIDTLGTVYYKGRKGGFDYFRTRKNLGGESLRLPISESLITKPFDYRFQKKNWRSACFMHLTGPELQKAILLEFNIDPVPAEPKANR